MSYFLSFRWIIAILDWLVAHLGDGANLATVVGTGFALGLWWHARKATMYHLISHISLSKNWVVGPHGAGWSRDEITPAVRLQFMQPRRRQYRLSSAEPFSQVTLLQNVVFPHYWTPHLVLVAQNINALNEVFAEYESVKTSDMQLYLTVETKLDRASGIVFAAAETIPNEVTCEQRDAYFTAAALTPHEREWCDALADLLVHAHVDHIGSRRTAGLFSALQALEKEVARDWMARRLKREAEARFRP